MHFVKPGPDFFKRFENPAALALNNVVIPFRIIPKPAFIARKMLSFILNLTKNCVLFTQIKIDSRNDLPSIGSIIDRYQAKAVIIVILRISIANYCFIPHRKGTFFFINI